MRALLWFQPMSIDEIYRLADQYPDEWVVIGDGAVLWHGHRESASAAAAAAWHPGDQTVPVVVPARADREVGRVIIRGRGAPVRLRMENRS